MPRLPLLLAVAALIACSDDSTSPSLTGFLRGSNGERDIGIVVNSLGKSVTLFQVGDPATQVEVPLGTSSSITPVGLSLRGRNAAVPLGNAGSVALINLETQTITRFFTFASGNTTGSAWSDDTTIVVANPALDKVGRVFIGQAGDAITTTADVAPEPSAVVTAGSRVAVISANLDPNFAPIGPGIVTFIDPKTMQVVGTVQSGGNNSTDAAVGPDGLLYVINTGDYVSDGSLTIIDPVAMTAVTTIDNIGVGPGAISIDARGLAYISSFVNGTLVWDTETRTFLRGLGNPVCAQHDGFCRGAFASAAATNGDLYQAFFGSPGEGLAPYVFVFSRDSYALRDSIPVGVSPSSLTIRRFQ